jgi:signal transduction histidine kinase
VSAAVVDPARLRAIELFAGLSDEQLAWLATQGRQLDLADGTVLFEDGEEGREFYVLLSGELLITKVVDGQEHVLGRHRAQPGCTGPYPAGPDGASPHAIRPDGEPAVAGQYTGELPMLAGGCHVAKATAVGHTELIAYDKPVFLGILARCPQVCQVLLPVLAWRIRGLELQSGRRVLLEGLGTLAAGLAHQLNNPAAAIVRCAGELSQAVCSLAAWAVRWGGQATQAEHRLLIERITAVAPRDPLDPAAGLAADPAAGLACDPACDPAEEIAGVLADRGVADPHELGLMLADAGVDPDELRSLDVRPEVFEAAVSFLAYSLEARELAEEAMEGGRRIEALVSQVMAYTDVGRAVRQDVDLAEGLEVTLGVNAAKLSGIRVRREYAGRLIVAGYPSELNQVWTNLIGNAADAMNGHGELRIRTYKEGEHAVVEIGDTGAGIPADVLPKLFQPFFTTKDIGQGTGLGLHLSRDIVVHRHHGSIDVTSVPGDTRFRVCLPLRGC